MSSCLMAAISGAQLVHDVGLLGNATVVMPEMIVATDEIVAMLHHLLGEVLVDPESLSLDLFAEVRHKSEFMTNSHTLAHLRDIWYPRFMYRGGARAWARSQPETFEQRINARTRAIMEQHSAALLPSDQRAAIDEILDHGVSVAAARSL